MERYPDDQWWLVDIEPGPYCPVRFLGADETPKTDFEFGTCKMEVIKTSSATVYRLHLLPKGPAE